MNDMQKINLFRSFEEAVWKLADASEKGNPQRIDKAEKAYMEVAEAMLAEMLGRKPTGQELSLATMY